MSDLRETIESFVAAAVRPAMLDSGEELSVPLPLTALTRQMFQAAISKGHGEEDICSTINVLEEFAGITVKVESAK